MIVDKKTLCQIFGVSERALTDWTKEGMPIAKVGGRGKPNDYETVDVLAWYIQRETDKATTEGEFQPDSALGAALMKERIRSTAAEADIKEHRKQLMRNEVVLADRVKEVWSRQTGEFRQAAMQLPMRLAPKLLNIQTQEEVKRLVKKETDSMLTALSQPVSYSSKSEDDSHEAAE